MNKNTIALAGTATIAAGSIALNVKQGATLALRAKQITLKDTVIKIAMDELLKVGSLRRQRDELIDEAVAFRAEKVVIDREIEGLRRYLGLAHKAVQDQFGVTLERLIHDDPFQGLDAA